MPDMEPWVCISASEVWGVTYFIDGSDEGISVIELFATQDLAIAFRDGYATHRDRKYGVTKFKLWGGVGE